MELQATANFSTLLLGISYKVKGHKISKEDTELEAPQIFVFSNKFLIIDWFICFFSLSIPLRILHAQLLPKQWCVSVSYPV